VADLDPASLPDRGANSEPGSSGPSRHWSDRARRRPAWRTYVGLPIEVLNDHKTGGGDDEVSKSHRCRVVRVLGTSVAWPAQREP